MRLSPLFNQRSRSVLTVSTVRGESLKLTKNVHIKKKKTSQENKM